MLVRGLPVGDANMYLLLPCQGGSTPGTPIFSALKPKTSAAPAPGAPAHSVAAVIASSTSLRRARVTQVSRAGLSLQKFQHAMRRRIGSRPCQGHDEARGNGVQ